LTSIRLAALKIAMFKVNKPAYEARMEQYVSKGQARELSLREIGKRRQITSTKIRLVYSIGFLLPTGGMTFVGVLLAKWRRDRAKTKYNIIVATMQKHGIPMPKHRKRDWAIPFAVNTTVYLATFGMIWGLDHVFSEAAMAMAPYGYVPMDAVVNVSGTTAAEQLMASPDLFMQGVLHGGAGAASFVGAAATENMGGVIHDLAVHATPMGMPLAYVAGEEVGSSVMIEAIRKGATVPFKPLINVRRIVD
jgi:hypothetical protein